MTDELVVALVRGLVSVLGAAALVELGVAFLHRAPADIDEAIS